MQHFSKKYNKWLEVKEQHPKCKYLYKFGSNFYYHKNKDMLIHISFVDDYIKKTMKIRWEKTKNKKPLS